MTPRQMRLLNTIHNGKNLLKYKCGIIDFERRLIDKKNNFPIFHSLNKNDKNL